MNSHLQSLNQTYVFAYILNYQPQVSSSDIGVLTIVDNSENNVTTLLSQYGFYIDNVFIAGGYGFRTLDDLNNAKEISDNFEEFSNNITSELNKINNKKTLFVFKGTQQSEIGSQEINLNILSPEYNSYNFITSYQYFKLDEENVFNSLDYKYTLSIKTQSDIRYINNINIIQDNNDEVIEIENINNTKKYKVKLSINSNTSNNVLTYNDDIKLYLYSRIAEENKNTPIQYSKTSSNWTSTYLFNKPSDSFDDDLILELRKPGESTGEEKIIYSYILPNFLRWQDKFVIYPNSNSTINNQYNNYNFRNTETDITNGECYNIYSNMIQSLFIENNYLNVNTNDEIILDFSSGIPMYDYIIFRNFYNIEFYFNGLQSKNWAYKTITINYKEYYIWQSPQKYIGNHTWKIKINM